jgi:hypothetical protein
MKSMPKLMSFTRKYKARLKILAKRKSMAYFAKKEFVTLATGNGKQSTVNKSLDGSMYPG